MTSRTTNEFSSEVRARAVRLVQDHEGDHASRWAAISSIAAKIGCSPHTLLEWVKKAEVDSGKRGGGSTLDSENRSNQRSRVISAPLIRNIHSTRAARAEFRSKTTTCKHDRDSHRFCEFDVASRRSAGEKRHGSPSISPSTTDKTRTGGDLPAGPSRSIRSRPHRSCRDRPIFRSERLDVANGGSRPRRSQMLCERDDRGGPDIPGEFRLEGEIGPRPNMVLKNERALVYSGRPFFWRG